MRVDAARNRTQIIGAACELVARDGSDVRMDDIADRAGVAVGTLYRHFPTKSDLVSAVVDESVRRIANLADEALQRCRGGRSAWAELEGFFAAIADGFSASRAVRLAARLLGIASESAELGTVPSGAASRSLGAIRELLQTAQDAGEMRPDVTLADLFMLLAQAPDRDEGQWRTRYVEIVSDGLRPSAARRPPQ